MNRRPQPTFQIPLLIGGAVVVLMLLGSAIWAFAAGSGPDASEPTVASVVADPASAGILRVETDHPVTIQLNGQSWVENQPIPAGRSTLVLKADGYEDMEKEIDVVPDGVVTLRGSLIDSTVPQVNLKASPTIAGQGTAISVSMYAFDPASRPAEVALLLDGNPVLNQPFSGQFTEDSAEAILTDLPLGLHRLEMTVFDGAGNAATDDMYIEVVAEAGLSTIGLLADDPGSDSALVGLTRSHSAGVPKDENEAISQPTTAANEVTPQAQAAQIAEETDSPKGAANVSETTVAIPTYAYADALLPLEDFVYPRLETALVGGIEDKTYHAVLLENDALRLTLLPALGGRLYQITDKTTGRDLLYNNPAVKPTGWGPEEMNWWLAVGGMEWAFPVEEHGYAWGMVWKIETDIDEQGAAVANMTYHDPASELTAEIELTLPSQGRSFTLAPTLVNESDQPKQGQLWVDVALPAGEGMAVQFPAELITIHSADEASGFAAGQRTNWLETFGQWRTWSGWFSAFAAPANSNELIAWPAGDGPGLKRIFDREAAPGVKFFTWGPEGDLAQFEGTPYFEIWGGLTPDFERPLTLDPGTRAGWVETWTIQARDQVGDQGQ